MPVEIKTGLVTLCYYVQLAKSTGPGAQPLHWTNYASPMTVLLVFIVPVLAERCIHSCLLANPGMTDFTIRPDELAGENLSRYIYIYICIC